MIWCVEKDTSIRDLELYTLRASGYEAEGFASGKELYTALRKEKPSLIVIDSELPGEGGMQILHSLRTEPETAGIPVILSSGKSGERIPESSPYAPDDYLPKPFGMMEMVARVAAVLEKVNTKPDIRLRWQGLELDPSARRVTADGEPVILTKKEFDMLRMFLAKPGSVLSREKLLKRVWGVEYIGESRTVDVHIRTLRRKLGDYGHCISTIRGVGYRWQD